VAPAPCWSAERNQGIALLWAQSRTLITVSGVETDEAASIDSPARASILIPALSLRADRTYEFSLAASMVADANATSTALVRLVVEREPMRAVIASGDRHVSRSRPFEVDASWSLDPNEPSALLSFRWALIDLGSGVDLLDGSSVLATNSTLIVPAAFAPLGSYTARVEVSSAHGSSGSAEVSVEVVAALVPRIRFAPLAASKLSPTWALPTERLVIGTSVEIDSAAVAPAAGLSFEWRRLS
jgi:hypothetical protein